MGYTNFPHGITSFGVPVGPSTQGLTGDAFFVTPSADSSTSHFKSWVEDNLPRDKCFTSVADAYAACTAYRNDTVYVFPGLYTTTATLDWTKDRTHLVGLGGPNVMTREGKPNCCVYTDTAAVDYTIHLTGDFCQFHNIQIQNGDTGGSADGDNLSAVGVAGYGNYFSHVLFRGINSAAQIADADCSSLEIMQGAGELMFEDCIIGQNGYGGTRTGVAGQGHLLWSATGAPAVEGMIYRRCTFLQRISNVACPMVAMVTSSGIDKLVLFDECTFSSYWVNWADKANTVFEARAGVSTSYVVLKDCVAAGWDYWEYAGAGASPGGAWVQTNQPASNYAGGIPVRCDS